MSKVEESRKNNLMDKDKYINTKQTKLFDIHPKEISKQKINELVFEYIVSEMRPLVTCEKPSFRKLILGLTQSNDETILPNRKQISKQLTTNYNAYVLMLTDVIEKQNYICTTADIWSGNNKSYMGMTCHFIDSESYLRKSYVLGCKRIKGSHNYLNIAEVMTEITQNYRIHYSKITHIVTDNASNFDKSFRTFSIGSSFQSTSEIGDLNENNSGSDNSDLEIDNLEIMDVDKLFINLEKEQHHLQNTDDSFCLPNHLKCCAHTLNLIATVDIAKITDTNYLCVSKSTFKKLYSFWNLISRSTVASDKVLEMCEEYSKTMEPLAISLDKLQGENRSFLGYVAPTILVLRRLLIASTNLKYCKPLSLIIIKSIETRFSYLFNLSSPESKIFIISSISHPKFKLSWVPVRFMNVCKTLFLNECSVVAATSEHFMNSVIENEEIDSDTSDHEFYSNICSTSTNNISINNTDSETKTLNYANLQGISFLSSNKKDLDILNQYPIIKEVFLKYNTTIPSSAPVERLFSKAIQVLTPRRNRLNDKTFDMILCCRSNMV
ncbi:uncharacterized protein LOC132924816 [Rhopalosiphum padi]|uniref:uncharacterized protein LOC132924815 n=1 Tax=Rhopalosiphum padi TaxID=40932 RepID=UPI00298D91AF|nr:uncharacterized protein LOC132924815 [Rhopalosiphum padi]XP_060845242.1 uncharacterized protein LOC132924816 [Rhopalosiphum padi]